MQTVTLHIGYAKAGTSLLQQRVFPDLPGINYLGRHTSNSVSRLGRIRARFQRSSSTSVPLQGSLDYRTPVGRQLHLIPRCQEDPELVGTIRTALKTWIGDRPGVLVSHENILRPGYTIGLAQSVRAVLADFHVRILITIREQADIIWSRYCHDLAVFGGDYSLRDVLSPGAPSSCFAPMCNATGVHCGCRLVGMRAIPPDFYDYAEIHQQFSDQFGSDNVLLMPLESWAASPLTMLQLLVEFVGGEIQSSMPKQLLPRVNAQSNGRRKRAERLNPDHRETLQTLRLRYADANTRLHERTGIDLPSLGYSGSEPFPFSNARPSCQTNQKRT